MGLYISERSVYSPTYTSTTTLVIRAKTGTAGAYTNLSVSAEMAEIFATVFQNATMRQKAAENIGKKSFESNIDAKLLGTIVHEKPHLSFKERLIRKKRSLLIDDAYSSLKFSEDYQNIATKLEYMHKHQNSKTFAITSVAENEGKSTAAANIALALAGRGFRVMLIDMDIRKPSIYKIFGYRNKLEHEFSDVLSQKISAKEYKFLQYKKSGLYLAMNRRYRSDAAQWLGSEIVSKCIQSISDRMDFVIIDTPPVAASADAASLVGICDKTLLVVRTDSVGVTDINDTVMTVSSIGNNLAGCILNDLYRPFTLFGQMGLDESNAYSYKHGSYKRYGYGPQALSEVMLDGED